jgi:hypothetical protein
MIRNLSIAAITSLALAAAAPGASADTTQKPVPSLVTTTARPAAPAAPHADPADAGRYAKRDANGQASKFTGGSYVVIGVSGGALLVALLIILILL